MTCGTLLAGTKEIMTMRRLLMLGLALQLAGCYTVDQSRFGNFVTGTIQPGMPMEQALVRMQAEEFFCNTSSGDSVTVCTRTHENLLRGTCTERVDIVRSAGSTKTVGAVDVLQIRCSKR
jgi:hypothetical protein